MTNPQRNSLGERNVEQDEQTLVWYIGKEEKQLRLIHVSRIIPGQRTATFQRYPRPEKEYQSFSLVYGKHSLDLVCKDKDEAEIWFTALRALISKSNCQKWRSEIKSDNISSDFYLTQRESQSTVSSSSSDAVYEDSRQSQIIPSPQHNRLGRAFSDLLYSTAVRSPQRDFGTNFPSSRSFRNIEDLSGRSSADTSRISSSSAVSSSSRGSFLEDLDTLCDLFLWGEGTGGGLLGGGVQRIGESSGATMDAFFPKALESTLELDIRNVACGSRHAVLVTKQGEVFSWGDSSGGRLGHGVETDICNPKLIDSLSGLSIESVACGEYHTCAITGSGNLYSWGDGTHNFGLLGHGNEFSHWTPKRLTRQIEDLHITSISCGPWHSAAITSLGQLFTFGDGSFGALGHGDLSSASIPREVETLKGLQTIRVSCGFWHTAAVVDVLPDSVSSDTSSKGRLFTWGDGNEGQLGHGDEASRLTPCCIASLRDTNFCQVACGHSFTVALTNLGQVYTMGRADYGQLGNPGNTGRSPTCVQGKIKNNFIEEIACGSFHVAALSSKSEVYTWGKGRSGQLGHGDNNDRYSPTLVEALKNKQVKKVACGNNFTAAICLHKCVSLADYSLCSGCSHPFNFKRKRHNCYNCGLLFCKACTSKKSVKASLAPKLNKSYRVCEDCFNKLNKGSDTALNSLPPRVSIEYKSRNSDELKEKVSDSKPRGLLSRLSSFDSFKRSEVWHSRKNQKSKSISGCLSPNRSRSCQYDRSHTLSPSRHMLDYSEEVSVSLHGSTMHSQAASPLYKGSSPIHSISLTSSFDSLARAQVVDDSKHTSNDLTKEISLLREQVDVLASRSNFLASELEKTSTELKKVMELAKNRAEKNNAAKEVVKSLMRQLKDMAAIVPSGPSPCRTSDPFADNSSSSLSITST